MKFHPHRIINEQPPRELTVLSLPMQRLLSSKHKDAKILDNCHFGIHRIALTEYYQMRTHMPGFWSIFSFLASIYIEKLATRSLRDNPSKYPKVFTDKPYNTLSS